MADDDRTTRPPQSGLSEEGSDVGGIPSTLNQGVDHASDRSGGRREGTLESDAGGIPPSLPVSQDSAALPSRPARDTTGSAVPADEGVAKDAGSDDSLPESLGKALSEPFKSD
jgi:hypothetical protein